MLNVRADRKDRIQLSAREKKLGGTSLCRITSLYRDQLSLMALFP
jgi:hypothetical protein